jgi:CBS domain-containing protein
MSFTTVGGICRRDVFVAAPQETLRIAAERMQTCRVGSLVICEDVDGRRIPTGIVTDRDIVLAILKHSTNLNSLQIRHAMSVDDLVGVLAEQLNRVAELIERQTRHLHASIAHLPITAPIVACAGGFGRKLCLEANEVIGSCLTHSALNT